MNNLEFEQFVKENGPAILRFCIVVTDSREEGQELYQNTMLILLEKLHKLDNSQNTKSYALSVAINLQKNRKKKKSTYSYFAVQGKDISVLQVYVFDNDEDWFDVYKGGTIDDAKERAVICEIINIE